MNVSSRKSFSSSITHGFPADYNMSGLSSILKSIQELYRICAILSLTFVAPKPEAANLPEICGLWSVLEVIDGGIQSIITAVVVIELCVLRVGEVGVERISIIQAIIRVGETRDHVVICNTQK